MAKPSSKDVDDEKSQNNGTTALMTDEEWSASKDNPHNWPALQKWLQAISMAYILMWMNAGSSMYVAGREYVAQSLDVGTELSILPQSLQTVGFVIGPIIAAPISESIGRLPVYRLVVPIAILFILGAGLSDHIYGVCICRFFVGLFGSAVASVGPGGTITDLFPPMERAKPLGFTNFMGFLGPVLGFLLVSFPVQYTSNWRYSSWTQLILGAPALLLLFGLRETQREAIQYQQSGTGTRYERFKINISRIWNLPYSRILQRPLRMLVLEPVVTAIGIYTGFSFALVYGMAAAVPFIYRTAYSFSLSESGLTWIAWIVGYLLGALANTWILGGIASKVRDPQFRAKYVPEWSLKPALIGSPLIPVALFWVAWSASPSIHWIVPIIAMGFYAAGTLMCFNSSLTYLAQYYGPKTGASATAGARILSFILGIAFPLFAIPLLQGLGIAWALSFLGFIGVALMPTPYLLYRFGPRLRAKSKGQH